MRWKPQLFYSCICCEAVHFFKPSSPSDKDKSSWRSQLERSGQPAHKVGTLVQTPKGLWFETHQKQWVLKACNTDDNVKSIQRGMPRCEEDLWLGDNLQIYACGLSPMLSKLVEILPVPDSESADIVWVRIYLKACSPTDKDKRSTRTVSQRSGQIVLEGWLQCTRVGAGDWFDTRWFRVFKSEARLARW